MMKVAVSSYSFSQAYRSGRITLFYYNSDDLQRIWDVLEMAREK